MLTVGGQEVGVTIERKSRPGGQKGLQPHGGRHGVPEPKLTARDRAEGRRRHQRHGRAGNPVVPPLRCDPRRGVSHCASACARRDVVVNVAGVDAIGPQRVAL